MSEIVTLGPSMLCRNLKKMCFTPTIIQQTSTEEESLLHDAHTMAAMEKVFNNPLEFLKIMNYLDFPDLLSTRLVNKYWKSISCEILKKRNCCEISILNNQGENVYYRGTSKTAPACDPLIGVHIPIQEKHLLSTLNNILARTTDFPCANFIIQSRNLNHPHIRTFFEIHASKIRALEIGMYRGLQDYDSRPIRLPRLQNLETLSLGHVDSNILDVIPPKLKSLTLNRYSVQAFADLPIAHLTEFGFRMSGSLCDEGKHLVKILEKNKDTLQSLNLQQEEPDMDSDVNLNIPVMKALTKLTFKFPKILTSPLLNHHFFDGLNLSTIFPNVQTLNLVNFVCYVDGNWTNYFGDFKGKLNSVKTIQVGGKCTRLWMKWLADLCPNVKHVKLVGIIDLFHSWVKLYKTWPGIEILELAFSDKMETLNLDHALTGLSRETCQRIIETGVPYEEIERLRGRWSIVKFKELKELHLIFYCRLQGIVAYRNQPDTFFSFLACEYAFRKMTKDLKVTMYYDRTAPWAHLLNKKLEGIRPYVTLVHRPAIQCEDV